MTTAIAALAMLSSGTPASSATPERTVKIAAGERYPMPPGGQTWILGDNYRALWATPIEVPVLDLETVASGLTPVRRVGGEQTLGLALRGGDRRDYTFRSVDKDLTHILPWFLRFEAVEDIAQDQLTATVPGVEVVVHPFARALGLIEPEARLVVMPDDPRLGEFQEVFAGRLGIFLEFPRPGFMGTTEIQDADDFWERRQDGPRNRADSRAFLRARLLDLFLGDWDRHRGQWRWARVPGKDLLQPVPEDRDQVFTSYEGLAMAIARANGIPLVTYAENYEPIDVATQNGWDLDRFILTDLDRSVWLETAEEVRATITDDVIDEGLSRLPPEYYGLAGASLTGLLRKRRDRIVELADVFYETLADKVDIQGSDRADVVTIEPRESGVVAVRIALAGESTPYYERVFLRDETKEIRIYLHGGDDRVVARASQGRAIAVHVIGDSGNDELVNESSTVHFWDFEGENSIEGNGRTKRHTRAYEDPGLKQPNEDVPWIPSRDWGKITKPRALFGFHPDAGVLIGGGFESTRFGFRKYPWSSYNTLVGGLAVGVVNRPLIDYKGDFRRAARSFHLAAESRFSGLDQLRYYGLGNETENDGTWDPYSISLYQSTLFPAFTYSRGAKGRVLVGPILKFSDSTGTEEGTVLSNEGPTGFGRVGQVGVKSELRYDTRVETDIFAPGLELSAEGVYYPKLWDIERAFGFLDARVDVHSPLSSRLFLTFSMGGKKVWGESFPFYEAAYLGGHGTSEGYNWNRFAGDASLYGIADFKIIVQQFRNFFPGELGIALQVDAGRVWLSGESSTKWHPAYGAGVFYAPFNRFALFKAGVGRSAERTFFIFKAQANFLEF